MNFCLSVIIHGPSTPLWLRIQVREYAHYKNDIDGQNRINNNNNNDNDYDYDYDYGGGGGGDAKSDSRLEIIYLKPSNKLQPLLHLQHYSNYCSSLFIFESVLGKFALHMQACQLNNDDENLKNDVFSLFF